MISGSADGLVLSTWSTVDRCWDAWDEAQTEAELAYEAWCRESGTKGYVVYRAAQDRADAAQDSLARCTCSAIRDGRLRAPR